MRSAFCSSHRSTRRRAERGKPCWASRVPSVQWGR
jgi:hypothetical protein